jgi:hypothetical protein
MGCKQIDSKKEKPGMIKPALEPVKVEKEIQSVQIKSFEVKIEYKYKDNIQETTYPSNVRLELILKEAEHKMSKAFIKHGNYIFLVNNEEVTPELRNKELQSFLNNKDEGQSISIVIKRVGLDLPDNDIIAEYYNNLSYYGHFLFQGDHLNLIIFDIKETKISLEKIEDDELQDYNNFSAFCNGNDQIYISGGLKQSTKKNMNNFSVFDLKSMKLMKNNIKLIIPRSQHSIIYIPNQFLFVVGGMDTKTVECYNSKTDEITEHSELNNFIREPTLIAVENSFLYAMTGKDCHFERINLRSNAKNWEQLKINFGPNISFNKQFFAVSYKNTSKYELLLIGGMNNNFSSSIKEGQPEYNYIYDYNKNTIVYSDIPNKLNLNSFPEKFFMPIAKNTSIGFPQIFESNEIKLYLYNDNKIEELNFHIKEE